MKLDHKRMLEDILPLVEDDFCFDMDCHNLPNSKPFTQEDAMEMAQRLGRVYSIAHGLHCVCGGKYKIKEASKGEQTSNQEYIGSLNPPQQEESPKEDDWKELSDLIHDAIYGGEVRGVDVIQRVNEKFILKSKVNKAIDGRLFIRPELDEFEKGCNMASRGIRRSLGLEEL